MQEVARQLGGAGKAARATEPQTFLLQNSALWVLTLSPFSRAQQDQAHLFKSSGFCQRFMVTLYRGKKGEILQWSEMQREAITKIRSNVGFLQWEGVC